MPLPVLSIFISADITLPSNPRELQKTVMAKLLHLNEAADLDAFATSAGIIGPLGETDICDWRDVLCADGLITALYWHDTNDHVILGEVSFDIDWLPPTAERIFMQGHDTKGMIHAALLPRRLTTLDFSHCKMDGKLDIENFPGAIEIARLSGNRFVGVLRLVRVPPKLRQLVLQNCMLSRVIVYNAGLPSCLERIDLRNNDRKIKWAVIDGKIADERIVAATGVA